MAKELTAKAKDLLFGFAKGTRVIYIPWHANGDSTHKDCQHGIVSSVQKNFVFVKYDTSYWKKTDPDESITAQATKRSNLVLETI